MGKVVKGVGNAVKGIGHAVGSVAKAASPFISAIPGVGNLAGAAIGGLGGLLSPGGGFKGMLQGAAQGGMGALGALGGLGKIPGVGGFLGAAGNALGNIPGVSAMGNALGNIPGISQLGGLFGNNQAGKLGFDDFGKFFGSPGGQALLAGGAGALAGATGAFNPKITQTSNAATPVAGDYASFLNSMMGSQSGAQNALQNMLAGRPGDPGSLSQYFNAGMGGNGQADLSGTQFSPERINVGYTPGDLQGLFNPMEISGQYGGQGANVQFNPTQFNADFTPQQIAAMEVQGGFNAPQFQQAQLQALNPVNVQQLGFNAPQFQNAQLNNLNLQNLGREQLATGPNTMLGFGERGQFGNVVNPAANQEALAAIMGRQQQRDIADLRERFGNRALSTGAMQAESLYRAEALPRQAMALDEIMRQNQAQQLTQRGQDIGAWQAGRGMDISQLGLGADSANALNQALIAQRGQDVSQLGLQAQTGLGLNEQQLQLAQLANQFGLDASQLGLQAGMANQDAMLQAAGLNQQGALGLNDQVLQQILAMNQFNQGNAQFGAGQDLQAQLANQNAMLQAAGLNTQQGQFGAQLGLDAQRLSDLSSQFGANLDLQSQLANIQNAQFGANFGQQSGMLNNQFAQAAAQQQLQALMANEQNRLAGSQQGIQADQLNNQFGLDAAQLLQSGLLQNQQLGNQWNLGLQNVGLGQQQNQLAAQQAALAQLFGGWNNMAGLGMAQAENVVGPSLGANIASGIGAAGDLMGVFNQARGMNPGGQQASLMGGGRTGAEIPRFSTMPQIGMTPGGGGNTLAGMMSKLAGGTNPLAQLLQARTPQVSMLPSTSMLPTPQFKMPVLMAGATY